MNQKGIILLCVISGLLLTGILVVVSYLINMDKPEEPAEVKIVERKKLEATEANIDLFMKLLSEELESYYDSYIIELTNETEQAEVSKSLVEKISTRFNSTTMSLLEDMYAFILKAANQNRERAQTLSTWYTAEFTTRLGEINKEWTELKTEINKDSKWVD